MKTRIKSELIPAITLFLFLMALNIGACTTADEGEIPVIITSAVDIITPVSALCIINTGSSIGSSIIEQGACWSTDPLPDITGNKISSGTEIGEFSVVIAGLIPETVYYVRAFSTNHTGTAYGEELQILTPKDLSGETGTVVDADGNIYPTIGIGSQIWMAENLKTTKFNDGTPILKTEDNSAWNALVTPGFCWYDNDESANKEVYGALYNGYAALSSKICPAGWHVPSDAEWSVLRLFGYGVDITNEATGFAPVAAGKRSSVGTFSQLRLYAFLWSSTSASDNGLWYCSIDFHTTDISRENQSILSGSSIRCVKD